MALYTNTPDPTAEAADVRDIIDTKLTDPDIQRQLQIAAAKNDEANDPTEQTTYVTGRIEAILAALQIRETRDRAVSTGQSESSMVSFEGSSLSALRAELKRLDDSGDLGNTVVRNSDRNTHTTEQRDDTVPHIEGRRGPGSEWS